MRPARHPGLAVTVLLPLIATGPAPVKPIVTWTPPRPPQGSLVRVVARPGAADSVAALRGELAGEPLHFERDGTGAYVAYGGVPVDARGKLTLPILVERVGGAVDSLVFTVPVVPAAFATEHLSVAPEYTEKPESALAGRIAREAAEVQAAWPGTHEVPRLWKAPFARPRRSRITSVFGSVREYNGVVQSRHLGVDFDGKVGETVRAANDGVVGLVGNHYYSGNIVVINHGGGIATAYLHMSRVLIRRGDTVTRGQLIGLVGATGRVTGPHLHWIAKYGMITVNPMSLITLTAEPRRSRPVAPRRPAQPGRTGGQ